MKLALASELHEHRHPPQQRSTHGAPIPSSPTSPLAQRMPGPSRPALRGLHPKARRSLRGLRPLDGAPDLYGLKKAVLSAFWDDAAHKAPSAVPCELDVGWVHLTCGATAALALVLRAFGDPRLDRIAIPTPCPTAFGHFAQLSELSTVCIPLKGPDRDTLDVDALIGAEAKLILLSDPNDPVGTRLRADQIEDLAARADALVIVDERQVELSEDPSAILRLADLPNLVLIRSLSHAWGLKGARCGAILAHPLIIHTLRLADIPAPLSDSAIAEATFVMEDTDAAVSAAAQLRVERDRLSMALRGIDGVRWVFPSEAAYVLTQLRDTNQALRRLAPLGVPLRDVRDQVPGALRLPIGSAAENDALLDALQGR